MSIKSYFLVNLIFAILLVIIFVYSGIFDPKQDKYFIKCIHTELLGRKCSTCGMSHGFSSILRGNINDALKFQPNSVPIFEFFAIQLSMRLLLIFLLKKSDIAYSYLTNIDITLTLLLFIFFFKNLIFQTFYILQMIINSFFQADFLF